MDMNINKNQAVAEAAANVSKNRSFKRVPKPPVWQPKQKQPM